MGVGIGIREFFRNLYRRRGIFYFLYRSIGEPTYPLLCLHWARWNAWASLTKKPLVHFIGDSHITSFNFQPRFIAHNIGQATAHNLCKQKSSSGSSKILSLVLSRIDKKRDFLCLVFGEIDCRIHFFYQHEKTGKPLAQLIGETIENYGSVILRLKNDGYRICVCSSPPAARQENIYCYPHYGSPAQRSKITKEFNEKLKGFCEKNSIPLIDIYSHAADENGFIPPSLARDEVHLNPKICQFARGEISRAFGIGL